MTSTAALRRLATHGSTAAAAAVQKACYSTGIASLNTASDVFAHRHSYQADNAEQGKQMESMLKTVGVKGVDELIQNTIPSNIYKPDILSRLDAQFPFKADRNRVDGESDVLQELYENYAKQNRVMKSMLGMGYYGTKTPAVILRNVLENPAWYTPYTPYQAEISQGRLESLLNYQTMIVDLTGMPIANASMLDEATAAAEAMTMAHNSWAGKVKVPKNGSLPRCAFLVSQDVHPQSIAVMRTRAEPRDIQIVTFDEQKDDLKQLIQQVGAKTPVVGAIVQYPNTHGAVKDYKSFTSTMHEAGAMAIVATDLLALTVLQPPGEFGADIAVGSNQRFGIPMGYGGPHAGFLSCKDEHKRIIPGRIIGVSKDAQGNRALRMALQTREQHIRREKATSNICTAQALLANISAFYAMYHGPNGLKNIAENVHKKTVVLARSLQALGYALFGGNNGAVFFDTITVDVPSYAQAKQIYDAAEVAGYNLRWTGDKQLGIAFDETTQVSDVVAVAGFFAQAAASAISAEQIVNKANAESIISSSSFKRTSSYLTHPVFNSYHTEHEMLRYIFHLSSKDISLVHSMIPLGSCTMKLNATSEMIPVTWPEFGAIHPFAPLQQTTGYQRLFKDLEGWLSTITGFDAVSLQPNAGSQGEYAGLMVIREYHRSRGDAHRNVCLIPVSAHGTNAASASMANMKVVPVECDANGNVDVADLKKKADEHSANLSCIMVTYPSTHGVFEESIREICHVVHSHGGQVYMDGANMNAQVGLTAPGYIGADVCHLNLHKTFCVPHGGGGPGMGPIGVKAHLKEFLPNHPVVPVSGNAAQLSSSRSMGTVSAAPWGSPSILPISWMYIRMMGGEGLKRATQVAILNANYIAKRLAGHYEVYYSGKNGFVAHELIIDIAPFKKATDVAAEDVSKRLMDYGFHAPTMSFPIPNTLMIEPTESESKAELDRFCDALISIRNEIRAIEEGRADKKDNVLKNAPHTAQVVMSDEWNHPYKREQAAYPLPYLRERKVWPTVSRIDSGYGDRNLICSCEPMERTFNDKRD